MKNSSRSFFRRPLGLQLAKKKKNLGRVERKKGVGAGKKPKKRRN
jgi:hypothetical protein